MTGDPNFRSNTTLRPWANVTLTAFATASTPSSGRRGLLLVCQLLCSHYWLTSLFVNSEASLVIATSLLHCKNVGLAEDKVFDTILDLGAAYWRR